MTKNQLDIFIRVAQTGSFSKAANAMYVTPSSVIQQMNLLESDLSAHLFIRTNHGVEPTIAGQVLYEEALKITQQFDSAKRRVKMAEEATHKYIRVGADLCRKCRFFPDYWSSFVSSEPYYEAKFVHYDGENDPEAFSTNYDLIETLKLSEVWKTGFEFLELFRCPSVCAVPKDHRLAGKSRISLSDLRGERLAYVRRGVDEALDATRNFIEHNEKEITLVDFDIFDETVFSACRLNCCLVQMPLCLQDICTDFVPIACDWECSQPYGFLYVSNPPEHIRRFVEFAEKTSALQGTECFLGRL